MKAVRFIAMLLIIIGALNWGLFGLFQYDFVADIFGGPDSALSRIVYTLVGIAGIYGISFLCNKHLCCGSCCKSDHDHGNHQ